MSNTQPEVSIDMTDGVGDNGRSRLTPTTPNRGRSPNRNRTPVRNPRSTSPRMPLLETEEFDPEQPPLAGPEIEDDGDDEDIPFTPEARPGVDDGFFPENKPKSNKPKPQPRQPGLIPPGNDIDMNNGNPPRRRGSVTPIFPYSPDFIPPGGVITGNDIPREIPDVNVYQQKKTLAQGMMDLALLSANANQLRYVVESYQRHPYYYFSVIFITTSLILQIAVGVGLIWNSRYNIKNEDDICKAEKINNYTIIGIFLVTVVNVFVSAFGVANPQITT